MHELNCNRKYAEVSAHLVAQSFCCIQSGGILFRGDDALGFRHAGKGVVDKLDVLSLELVMVAEGQRSDGSRQWGDVVNHLFW